MTGRKCGFKKVQLNTLLCVPFDSEISGGNIEKKSVDIGATAKGDWPFESRRLTQGGVVNWFHVVWGLRAMKRNVVHGSMNEVLCTIKKKHLSRFFCGKILSQYHFSRYLIKFSKLSCHFLQSNNFLNLNYLNNTIKLLHISLTFIKINI